MRLESLGLTKNEAKVYETLLRVGKTTASHIAKESRVPYGRIYTVLGSLEQKGLVKVIPEDTKKYVPSDPQEIEGFIAQMKDSLHELEDKVKNYKALYAERTEEPVQVAIGKGAFHKIASQMKIAKNLQYSIKYNFDPRPEFIREVKDYKKKGVDYKVIGRIDAETKNAADIWRPIVKDIVHIDNEGVAISIIDDEQLMIGMIKSNTTILIQDKPFIRLFTKLYLAYYEKDRKEPVK